MLVSVFSLVATRYPQMPILLILNPLKAEFFSTLKVFLGFKRQYLNDH